MKFIRLEILNLASLDRPEGEMIDFTQGILGDSNIFSIVGPTGSGKSTLLDAICLALYDRAPRYPRKARGQGKIIIYGTPDANESNRLAPTDCRNILTRGRKDGYSKLTFLANDGTCYRAEWHVSFKRSRYANTLKLLYKLIPSDEGRIVEQEDDWNRLPQIIGLEYEQFLNTVLIAQGAFARFLNTKEEDRFALLEKLIGCEELYTRIATEIDNQNRAANEALNKINATVDEIKQNVLNEKELTELNTTIEQLEKAQKTLSEQLKLVENDLKWYDDAQLKASSLASCQTSAEDAKAALEAYSERIHRLALHDALDPAIDLLREVKRLESTIEQTKQAIADNKAKILQQEDILQNEDKKLEQLKADAASAQKLLDETTPHIIEARQLKTKMEGAQNTLVERKDALDTAQSEERFAMKERTDNDSAIKQGQTQLATAEDELKKKQEMLNNEREELAEDVNSAKSQIKVEQAKVEGKNADQLQREKTAAQNALHDITHAIEVVDKLDQCLDEKQQKEVRKTELKHQSQKAQDELSHLTIDSLAKEVEKLTKAYTLITSEEWDSHRHLLHDGEACPLCGATSHPFKSNKKQLDETTNDLHSLLTDKQAELKRQQTIERTQSSIIKSNEGELRGIGQRLEQLANEMMLLEREWNALSQQYPSWPKNKSQLDSLMPKYQARNEAADRDLKDFNHVQEHIAELIKKKDLAIKARDEFEKEASTTIEQLKQEVQSINTNLSGLLALSPKLKEQHEEKKKAAATANESWQRAKEVLEQLKQLFDKELGGEQPDAVEHRLKHSKEQADTAVTQQTEHIAKMRTDLGTLKGSLQTQNDQQTLQENDHNDKQGQLKGWIANYNASADRVKEVTMGDVNSLLLATDDWELVRRKREELTHNVATTQALLKQARDEHDSHLATKPKATREQLTEKLPELQKLDADNQSQLIIAQTQHQQHVNALANLGLKDQELRRSQQLCNDWKAIYDAIGNATGTTMRKIAQCYTLGFLIEHANAEIRKFNSRYELQQVKNSLGIRVIDHDRADDVRDTTSLSGGETFIVSLGLALGLAALSSRNISFDNLFIDEGFGTLDPDTLATVIDSLAMLQTSQGKKVGVISHTDTMSERITTQIRIIPNGTTGSSHIEISDGR